MHACVRACACVVKCNSVIVLEVVKSGWTCMKVELGEERVNSERYKKQSQILRLELDHLLQQLTAYVSLFCSGTV